MQLNIIQIKKLILEGLDLLSDGEVIQIYAEESYNQLDNNSKEIIMFRLEEIFNESMGDGNGQS